MTDTLNFNRETVQQLIDDMFDQIDLSNGTAGLDEQVLSIFAIWNQLAGAYRLFQKSPGFQTSRSQSATEVSQEVDAIERLFLLAMERLNDQQRQLARRCTGEWLQQAQFQLHPR